LINILSFNTYFKRCCPIRRTDERLFNIILDKLDDIEAQAKQKSQNMEQEIGCPAEIPHFMKQDVLIDGELERSMESI
jgi:hypothetical protein